MLYGVASTSEARRADGHDEIYVGVVVVLEDGGNVHHVGLGIRLANFEILPFLEAVRLQTINQSLHTLFGSNAGSVVNDCRLHGPGRGSSSRVAGGVGHGCFSMT